MPSAGSSIQYWPARLQCLHTVPSSVSSTASAIGGSSVPQANLHLHHLPPADTRPNCVGPLKKPVFANMVTNANSRTEYENSATCNATPSIRQSCVARFTQSVSVLMDPVAILYTTQKKRDVVNHHLLVVLQHLFHLVVR